ncbi:MAG: DNA polymerase III subunit beta, partial [Ktedonobacterales bacterium]|nr:DNA polymerase III subunit beta [Ktedonobacterales bacterium]
YNSAYLLDALNAIDTPEVDLRLSPENRPLMIRPMGQGDEFRICIMPLYNRG